VVFFFLKDGTKIIRFIYNATPLAESTKSELFKNLTETFDAALRGQVITSTAQSVLAGLTFWILGLPLPIFFALITFIATMFPFFGAALVWFPFVIYLFLKGHLIKAVILMVLGTLAISLVDNFLKPLIIGQGAKLPYLLLFFGILGGLEIYGLIGVFVAPIVLSIFFVLIKMAREEFLA
jgi:predicted PurR-regulated permease PerM